MENPTAAILFLMLGGSVLALYAYGVFGSPGQGAGVQHPGEAGSSGALFPVLTLPSQATQAPAGTTAPVDILAGLSDVEVMARTIYAEDRSGGSGGMSAVAAVIMNRVKSPHYPDTIKAVCLQPGQFSCWNHANPNASSALGVQRGNALFDVALSIAASDATGLYSDPTGGATMYYSPRTMTPPGAIPHWDFSKLIQTATIDGELFYREV